MLLGAPHGEGTCGFSSHPMRLPFVFRNYVKQRYTGLWPPNHCKHGDRIDLGRWLISSLCFLFAFFIYLSCLRGYVFVLLSHSFSCLCSTCCNPQSMYILVCFLMHWHPERAAVVSGSALSCFLFSIAISHRKPSSPAGRKKEALRLLADSQVRLCGGHPSLTVG